MLSAHEFATLMLVKDAADHIAGREELDALLDRQLVALGRLAGGAVRPRITEDGGLFSVTLPLSIDEKEPSGASRGFPTARPAGGMDSAQRFQTALATFVISTASIALHGLCSVRDNAPVFCTPHALPEKSEIVC